MQQHCLRGWDKLGWWGAATGPLDGLRRRASELPTVGDGDAAIWFAALAAIRLHSFNNIHAVHHSSEDYVLAVQPADRPSERSQL